MVLATFYFQLHQPFRLHHDRGKFLWDEKNEEVFKKVRGKCYLPATRMFTQLIKDNPNFKLTFGVSGVFLEQAEKYCPEVITVLQNLYDAGKENNQIEFLDETYYHSLASLFEDPKKREFREQVSLHRQKLEEIFGQEATPTSFRNTELMYNNDIAEVVTDMGYKAILCEKRNDMFTPKDGKPISPNAIFKAVGKNKQPLELIIIPRNRELSDDVAYRFPNSHVSAEHYAWGIAQISGEAVLLGYDYEHIGEHIWEDKGIFDFWKNLPRNISKYKNIVIANPTEIAERFKEADCPRVDIHGLSTSSWADVGRNTFGWLGNKTQCILFKDIELIEDSARKAGGELLKKWRHLTTSDQVYFLHEGTGHDNAVHAYFSPYDRSVATATHVLTRKVDDLEAAIKNFYILKKTEKTPVIIISPETAKLPSEGMGDFAKYVSGKSGGLGEVISSLCRGLVEREIPTHFITLNLKRRFREESGMSEEEWVHKRNRLPNKNIHLVTSSLFEDYYSPYDYNPIETAAEFQKQIINSLIKEIRSDYGGRAIIHTHDWMAGGAISAYAKMRGIPSLHTVHNTHTGHIPVDMLREAGLVRMWKNLYLSWDQGRRCVDAQATAIKSATKINYVGQKFLDEIINDYFLDRWIIPPSVRDETKAKHYYGSALVIPNGISPAMYPENQKEDPDWNKPGLAKKYSCDDKVIEAKKANLLKFQRKIGLIENPDAILLYWPSRLDPSQKGIELLEDIALKFVIENPDVQIAVVGNPVGSDITHKEIMGRIACASGGKIAYNHFYEDLSILGYAAASDVFGASLYEPFGQIDVVGNLFGATTTNRDTGGYHDKITPLELKAWGAPQDTGNGVLFRNYDSNGLWWALNKTSQNHRYFRNNPDEWEKQAKRIMKEAKERHSPENMIASYITAYKQLNNGKPLA